MPFLLIGQCLHESIYERRGDYELHNGFNWNLLTVLGKFDLLIRKRSRNSYCTQGEIVGRVSNTDIVHVVRRGVRLWAQMDLSCHLLNRLLFSGALRHLLYDPTTLHRATLVI